jgi:hypothetical protein
MASDVSDCRSDPVIRRLAVVAAAVGLLAAGCGGSSDSDNLDNYFQEVSVEQDAYWQAQKGALRAMDLLSKATFTAVDCRQSARLMGTARDAYGELGGRLGRIDPPAALRDAHQKLARSLRLYSLYFEQLRQVIGFCNAGQLTAASMSKLPDRARALRSDWRVKAIRYADRTGVVFPAWAEEVGRLQGGNGSGTGI